MVFIVMNVFYALAAYPAGTLSDRFNRLTILSIGIAFLIAADAALIVSTSLAGLALATVLWGLHMGFTQGLLAALVADAAPPDLRGAAYGLLNLSAGLAALATSAITGALWDIAGPRAAFVPGGAFAALALICVLLVRRRAPIPCIEEKRRHVDVGMQAGEDETIDKCEPQAKRSDRRPSVTADDRHRPQAPRLPTECDTSNLTKGTIARNARTNRALRKCPAKSRPPRPQRPSHAITARR